MPQLGAARRNTSARVQLQLAETFGFSRADIAQLLLPALSGAIGELEVIDFLKALVRHIKQPLLIVWDRLPAHRSRLVQEFIELSEGHIATEYLPPYAPELNPVEYIWAYWKQHELPNVCPKDYWELDQRARKALRRMRRKPRWIAAFSKQSALCFD